MAARLCDSSISLIVKLAKCMIILEVNISKLGTILLFMCLITLFVIFIKMRYIYTDEYAACYETNFNNHFNSIVFFISYLRSGGGYESW